MRRTQREHEPVAVLTVNDRIIDGSFVLDNETQQQYLITVDNNQPTIVINGLTYLLVSEAELLAY